MDNKDKKGKVVSLAKQLLRSYLLIIVILGVIFSVVYFFSLNIHKRILNEIEKQSEFNKYFILLKDVQVKLRAYLASEYLDALDEYREKEGELRISAAVLAKYYPSLEYVDNIYMTDTYLDQADKAVQLKENGDMSYYEHLTDAAYTKELIEGRYSTLYQIVANTLEEQTKIYRRQYEEFIFSGVLIMSACVLAFAFSKRISRRIVRPVSRLADAANNAVAGNLNFDNIPYKQQDEIKILIESFRTMVSTIKNQISELEEKAYLEQKLQEEKINNVLAQKLLKESELKVLQASINPHFLFNSLNIISQMAYIEGSEKTRDMSIALSDLLRYNLQNINHIVTIKEDLKSIKNYIFILKQRFGDRIIFNIVCDENCLNLQIPSLVIQPFVENSINHGVKVYGSGGTVCLTIHRDDKKVYISVYDNGIGIPDVKLELIQKKIINREIEDSSNEIGIVNVCSRLRILFGDEFNINITSIPYKYTEVRFSIPAITEEIHV